jgi:RNA polymerase sigma-B factor
MRNAAEVLTHRLGRDPSDAELASYLGVTEHELLEARRADVVFHVYSLDAPLSEREDSNELADVLGTEDEDVQHTVDMEAVTAHWGELPAREQHILLLRFYGNLTQAEIGERLGISQMHVSRLLARALDFLRQRLSSEEQDAPAGTVMAG